MNEADGGVVRRHYEKGLLSMEISYLKETDGTETWTLLDNKEGHRNFDTQAESIAEFDARVKRRNSNG